MGVKQHISTASSSSSIFLTRSILCFICKHDALQIQPLRGADRPTCKYRRSKPYIHP